MMSQSDQIHVINGLAQAAQGFDDMASDLDGAPVVQSEAVAAAPLYSQPCPRCAGSGRYRGPSSHGRDCFKCNGAGVLQFKTSPFQRLKARQQAQSRVERKGAAAFEAFRQSNPAEAQWIESRADSFDFAKKMREVFDKYSELSPGQLAAVQKCVIGDADRAERRKVAEQDRLVIAAAAPAVAQVDKLDQAFGAALGAGVKHPKLRLDSFIFSPAKPEGKNPGAIYVKEDGVYLGKVAGGRFLRGRDCNAEQEARVVAAASDPAAAAVAFGKRWGKCSVCARDLENAESIELGIGPICRSRMGW